ncbi:MAG: hypothetical protein NZM00_02525, partial [Anaerolinea sp.]|nr:hypothetical protein [Anaerolinea sp.]
MHLTHTFNLRTKILLGFSITLVVFGLISLYTILVVQDSWQNAAQIIERYQPVNNALLEFKTHNLEVLASTVEVSLLYLNRADRELIDEEMQQINDARADVESQLEIIERDLAQFFPSLQRQFD